MEKANASVFQYMDGKAKKTPVKLGFNDGTNVEIASGLSGGERVLIFGKTPPADGQPVNATEAK
jgi:multidrug efflux pump subunit AcrA (membrane-fusion protein)